MSTYWGYVCESHDPPLTSEHWFNHGEEVLTQAYTLERQGQWPNDTEFMLKYPALDPSPMPIDHRGYVTTWPIEWLREHPNCTVALHNEYGDRKPLT